MTSVSRRRIASLASDDPGQEEDDRPIMSDDERDIDSDCDGQADKRAHHNALERKRRDHIKDSFSSLRDAIPSLHGEKASRAQILKKAAEYIQTMRKKNNSQQQDIEDLRKQNKVLEEQIARWQGSLLDQSPQPTE